MTGDKQHDATAELNEALAAGFAAGNFEAIGPFYTEDATLLPPRGQSRDGRAAIPAFWQGVANRFASVVFTTAAVKDLGDAARRETGTYVMGGTDGQSVEGKYVFVWQLVDGEWQIESAIWNRSGDAGGGRRQGQGRGPGRQGGQGAGQAGGYRQGGGQGRGYRQGGGGGAGGGYGRGGGRPSFQGGGAGAGRRRPGGGQGTTGGGSLYDGNGGLYSEPKA